MACPQRQLVAGRKPGRLYARHRFRRHHRAGRRVLDGGFRLSGSTPAGPAAAGHEAREARRGLIELLIGATIISFAPVFVRYADVDPTAAGFYRSLFGAIALIVYTLWQRETFWKGPKILGFALLGGILFAADLTVWHKSIHYIGPGLATILGNFQVFFLAAFGILVLRERPDWRFLVAIPIALTGLMLLVGVDWDALEAGYQLGVWFGLATAVFYALYVLVLRKSRSTRNRLSPSANLALITIVTGLVIGIEIPILGESFRIGNTSSFVAMIFYGVFCQGLGWIFISHGLARVPASRAGLILLLQPTLAFIWDIILFQRPTDGSDAIGAALALGAIYLGTTRSTNRKHTPRSPTDS